MCKNIQNYCNFALLFSNKNMTRFFKILMLFFLLRTSGALGQHLAGFNAYYMQSKIAGDSSGMKKILFAEPGFGYGIAYKHLELRNIIGFQGEINIQNWGFRAEPFYPELEFNPESVPEPDQKLEVESEPESEPESDLPQLYYTRRLKSVNIPLYMHVDFGQHSVKAVFAIGTYVNFLLSKSEPETNIKDFNNTGIDRIANGSYNTFTYGLCGQAGIAFCTKAGVFQLTGRGSVGMSRMIKMKEIALLSYITERSFGLGFSYYVPFGKEPYYTKKEKIRDGEKLDTLEIVKENSAKEEEKTDASENQTEKNAPDEEDLNWEQRYENQ